MADHVNILGVDIGSVTISVAEISPEREILKTAYQFHHGNVPETFTDILNAFPLGRISGIAATSSTPSIIKTGRRYDNRVAIITAARHFHEEIGAILVVGGETFSLIGFDRDGHYRSFRINTSCAAGTGTFLDQQARRLNLRDAQELSDRAFTNGGSIPGIASRCAVFAKTDLVHAQQEGYSLEQICDGLCYGLARNITDTLSMDKELFEPVIFTGGVSRNRAVVNHIKSITGKEVLPDETGVYGAVGAAFLMAEDCYGEKTEPWGPVNDLIHRKTFHKRYFHEPLMLSLSAYPEFDGIEHYEYPDSDTTVPYPWRWIFMKN